MHKISIFLLVCFSLITGCSNIKPYQSHAPDNLFITSKTDPNVKATIDIYHVNKACELNYRGSLSLEDQTAKTGISHDQLTYLVVNFSSSSFWSARSSNMSQEILLRPDNQYKYLLNISYIENIYNIELKATHLKSRKTTTVDTDGLGVCAPR